MKPILLIGKLFLECDSKEFLNWGCKIAAMKNTILLLGVFLCSLSLNAIGQENSSTEPTVHQENDIKRKWDEAVGTFQFEISNKKSEGRNFQIEMAVIDQILEARDDKDVVYLEYNNFIRIKVLPLSVINGDYNELEIVRRVNNFENL